MRFNTANTIKEGICSHFNTDGDTYTRGNQLSGYSIVIAGVLSITSFNTDDTSRVETGRHDRFLR